MANNESTHPPYRLQKVPTGVDGFDTITGGGLPAGRATLVAGGPGCGKTLFGTEFIVRGATEFDEPGVIVTFEESEQEVITNAASLSFDLRQLIDTKKLVIEHVSVDVGEVEEAGSYNLEALFIRLAEAIDAVGAKRIVLDTLEGLFSVFHNHTILRSEIRRLFRWLKDRQIAAVITGEKGDGDRLTRFGLEEYVSDCVILLEHTRRGGLFTRSVRVAKYRGTGHQTNEYPFLIGDSGFSVIPITSVTLDHEVSSERISTGISGLDDMLEGKGFYRGSSNLVSGMAGTGKTTIGVHVTASACAREERVLYIAFEESSAQIVRNAATCGIDLQPFQATGLLQIHSKRVSLYGMESHLTNLYQKIDTFKPDVIVMDPLNSFLDETDSTEVKSLVVRLVDLIKSRGITGVFSSLTSGSSIEEATDIKVSSLMDTWILLTTLEENGERNRGIYVLKARGIANSNQVREFRIGTGGIELRDVYIGTSGIVTGSARDVQEIEDRQKISRIERELQHLSEEIEKKRELARSQAEAVELHFRLEESQISGAISDLEHQLQQLNRSMDQVREGRSR